VALNFVDPWAWVRQAIEASVPDAVLVNPLLQKSRKDRVVGGSSLTGCTNFTRDVWASLSRVVLHRPIVRNARVRP